MQIQIAIQTDDKALLNTIFNEPVVANAKPISLGSGVELRGMGWEFNKAVDAGDFALVALSVAASIPAQIAAGLLLDWLKENRNRIRRVAIDRTELRLDDEGQVRKIIFERITHQD
jgi:hypothetical protein